MSTVLLVDDTPSQLELMAKYLSEGGYTIIRAREPKEAINQAVKHKPDVIITDVVMPGMSGFELCRCLKQHPVTAKIPIVICSSKDQEIDRIWGMKQGAIAYLTKPFSQEELIRTIGLAVA
jgi:twitching motility two-component system response regulator PilH